MESLDIDLSKFDEIQSQQVNRNGFRKAIVHMIISANHKFDYDHALNRVTCVNRNVG